MGIDRKRMLEVADGVERVASRVDAVLARRDAKKSHAGHAEALAAGFKHEDTYGQDRHTTSHAYTHPEGHTLGIHSVRNGGMSGFMLTPKGGETVLGNNSREFKRAVSKFSARHDDAGDAMADADNIASHKLALQHGYKNEEVNDLGNGDYAMLYTHPKGHSLATITSTRGGMKSFVHTPQSGDEMEGTSHAHLKKILAQHDDAR